LGGVVGFFLCVFGLVFNFVDSLVQVLERPLRVGDALSEPLCAGVYRSGLIHYVASGLVLLRARGRHLRLRGNGSCSYRDNSEEKEAKKSARIFRHYFFFSRSLQG